jgi:hypothetical protein
VSRRVQNDFAELKTFVAEYSLAPRISNDDYLRLLSRLHKRYYAILVFLAELGASQRKIKSKFALENARISGLYLREFISDLAAAFFDWLHGGYKPSRLSLRSSIENLIKALCIPTRPEIVRQRNVYEVFKIAAETPLLMTTQGKLLFLRLRSTYAILCVDAHGGSIAHLAQIASFGYFPKFDKARAERLAKLYSDVARDGLSLLSLDSPDVLKKMHHENADVVTSILPTAVKRALHDLD